MKIRLLTTVILTCAISALLVGCKKEEVPPATPEAPKAEGLSSQANKAVDTLKTTAKEVTDQATTQVKAAQDQTQAIIDRAKSFIAEKKYQDALSGLNQLAGAKLTPEQQTMVNDLKAQIQAALAKASGSSADAASAISGALGGKK